MEFHKDYRNLPWFVIYGVQAMYMSLTKWPIVVRDSYTRIQEIYNHTSINQSPMAYLRMSCFLFGKFLKTFCKFILLRKREIIGVLFTVLLACTCYSIYPPSPKICGTKGGPPITASRIKLRDGRHLAYKEHGVSRDIARHKIIYVHDFASTRHDCSVLTNIPWQVIGELGVHIVSFDRPGYGESDPAPKRTPKSLALDIEELADHLGLGSRFYVIGLSMGGQALWGCLKYIPHRLAGATMIAPVVNFWWPGLPANLSNEAYYKQQPHHQWRQRVAHYTPWLSHWWNTKKWFSSSTLVDTSPEVVSGKSKQEMNQQGEFESLHRDLIVAFGKWEFDPMDIENSKRSVHLWQGVQDMVVSVSLQRYIAQKLPWIHYHEVPEAGHFLPKIPGMTEAILKALLLNEN